MICVTLKQNEGKHTQIKMTRNWHWCHCQIYVVTFWHKIAID